MRRRARAALQRRDVERERNMRAILAALVLMVPAAPAAATTDCPLLKAVYEPVDAVAGAAYSARHVDRKVGANQATYVLRLSEAVAGRAYDFSFAYANGYGGGGVVFAGTPDEPQRKARRFDPGSAILYFDEKLALGPDYADPDKPAPAWLLMPEIGKTFWYWDKGDRKFTPPGGMWRQ
jgi:hypothetical protein